jgi:ABC-2 type transport system permease protein
MSTHAVLLPQRTPRSAFGKLLQNEGRYAWRVPVGLLMGVGIPVLALVIMGVIPGTNKPVKSLGGLTVFSTYFPVLIALALGMIGLISLPGHLADYRQQGILRRLSTTPVPPAWMLAAQVVINLALAVLALGILMVAGLAGFGLGAPGQPGGFALALVLTIAAMFAIGLWIAAIARSTNYAALIGNLMFYPMLFFAGLFFPRQELPSVVQDIGKWTPLGASVQALQDSMRGVFPSASLLLALAAWAVVFGVLAVRFFRWE